MYVRKKLANQELLKQHTTHASSLHDGLAGLGLVVQQPQQRLAEEPLRGVLKREQRGATAAAAHQRARLQLLRARAAEDGAGGGAIVVVADIGMQPVD